MVTIVLLNDAWIWATPFATFFLSLPFFAICSPWNGHRPGRSWSSRDLH
jgi:hypothetical protein